MKRIFLAAVGAIVLFSALASDAQTTQPVDLEHEVITAITRIERDFSRPDPASYGAAILPILQDVLDESVRFSISQRSRALLLLARIETPEKLVLKPIVARYLQADEDLLRLRGVVAYRSMATADDAAVLATMLHDPDASVRCEALQAFLQPALRNNVRTLSLWYTQTLRADAARAESARWLSRDVVKLYMKVMQFQQQLGQPDPLS
jgi:hypothetical protein